MNAAASLSYDRWYRDHDWIMIGAALAIALLGLVQIYSATRSTKFHSACSQHVIWLALAVIAFWAMSKIGYRQLISLSPLLCGVGVLLLVSTLLLADPVNGSRRWLPLPGGNNIQISEFMKLVLLLVVAKYCSGHATKTLRLRNLLPAALFFLAVFLLVVLQPDLSTALSMLPIALTVLFLSRLAKKYWLLGALAAVLLVPALWYSLAPYQKSRIIGFMDPEDAPLGSGYQIRQAKIAVGTGGVWGQGFVQGSQTQLRFLPAPHTDFILASFAEERGFAGVAVVLGLYYILLMRILDTAGSARDPEGALLAMGVASVLLFHITVNGGMVANKLPVTGLPLPLMSYGGSNLLMVAAMLGTVNSVRIRQFVN
ncbi:MAG: rod shape-determining protein RodA [Bryobacterales bacterium]|nr:rod shape-determining protein RodA [Bryobacterales bacterium]